MNRTQLQALLVAGLITQQQYAEALCTLSAAGQVLAPPTLDMHVAGVRLEVAAEDASDPNGGRTLRGLFSVYDELIPSHNMVLQAGSLQPRQPLNRVKVLRDHNHADPLGYVTAFDAESLEGDLFIPSDSAGNGDRALEDVTNGIRDGLSVGFTITRYELDDQWTIHVSEAELYEVSLCAIPAVADAGIYSVAAALAAARKEGTIMNRAQLAAALAAGTITQVQHDAALAAIVAVELAPAPLLPTAPAVAAPVPAELAAGPVAVPPAAPPVVVQDRGLSLSEVNRRLTAAFDSGDRRQIVLALSDILPAADAGEAYVNRPEWLDELFTANATSRPYIEAIGGPLPLTALRAKGYRWGTKPTVSEYAGNKAEIASSLATTVGDDFVAFRIAAGWDIDRAYVDFGDGEFLSKFWAHVLEDYQIKSETGIRTRVQALKTNASGSVTSGVLAILKQVIRDFRAIPGASVNRIFLSDSLFTMLEDINLETLPLWLRGAEFGVNITDGSGDVGQLKIGLDTTLVAGELVAFDNRGLDVRERQIPQVYAIDLAHGGIDLGFFSYLRLDDVDPRLVVRRKYVAA